MTWPLEEALESTFAPFAFFQEHFGFVPNLFRAQTLLPRVIAAEAQVAAAVLLKEAALPRTTKELILLTVAAGHRNTYCVTAHYQMLRSLGVPQSQLDQVLADPHEAGLPAADAALLDFALKLGQQGPLVCRADIDALRGHGFSDPQTLEVVLVTALTNFLCKLAEGLGVKPDFEPQKIPVSRTVRRERATPSDETWTPYLSAVELRPDTFAPFAFLQQRFGFIPNIFRAQTLRPDVLEAEANMVGTVLLTEDILTRRQKEYILLVISAANLNTYCVAVHCEMLRALGVSPEHSDQIALDHHYASLAAADSALLDFVLKLAKRPGEFGLEDIELLRRHGFTDRQILEAVVMTALTAFLNTVQMGLAPAPDFEPKRVFRSSETKLFPRAERPMPVEDPDAALVSKAQQGDLEAFEELVRRHTRRIYRTLMGILCDSEGARDATQDVFLKAFEHVAEFQGRSTFSTWLARIAHNTGIGLLRERPDLESLDDAPDREQYAQPRLVQAWADDPERLYSRKEIQELVEKEVTKLPLAYRVVVILRDVEQLSTQEAAAALGLGISALKARLFRGRLMLREALSPHFLERARRSTV